VTLARILSHIPLSRGGPTSTIIFDIHALQVLTKHTPMNPLTHPYITPKAPLTHPYYAPNTSLNTHLRPAGAFLLRRQHHAVLRGGAVPSLFLPGTPAHHCHNIGPCFKAEPGHSSSPPCLYMVHLNTTTAAAADTPCVAAVQGLPTRHIYSSSASTFQVLSGDTSRGFCPGVRPCLSHPHPKTRKCCQ